MAAVKNGSPSADDADHGEEVLVQRARTGDAAACAALMRRYNQRLYRVIRAVLKTRTFHKVVMGLTIFAIVAVAINFIGAFTVDPVSMSNALPALGTSPKQL